MEAVSWTTKRRFLYWIKSKVLGSSESSLQANSFSKIMFQKKYFQSRRKMKLFLGVISFMSCRDMRSLSMNNMGSSRGHGDLD